MRYTWQQEKQDWVSQLKPKAMGKVFCHATETKGHVLSAAVLIECKCSDLQISFVYGTTIWVNWSWVLLIKSRNQFSSTPTPHSHSFFFPTGGWSPESPNKAGEGTQPQSHFPQASTRRTAQVVHNTFKDFPQGRAHFSNFPKGKWVSSGPIWIRLRI